MVNFLQSVFELWVEFFDSALLNYWFYPVLCLCFIGSVPAIIRELTRWR